MSTWSRFEIQALFSEREDTIVDLTSEMSSGKFPGGAEDLREYHWRRNLRFTFDYLFKCPGFWFNFFVKFGLMSFHLFCLVQIIKSKT